MKKFKSISTYLLLIVAVLVLINIISDRFFVRLDLTDDNRYTLSKASKDIMRSLDEPVTVTAYFSENIPAHLTKVRRDFKEMLVEYNNLSKGMLVYEFVDPLKNEALESKARSAGIQPVVSQIREKDQQQQIMIYMGAVISKGENAEVIPFMQVGAAMEYSLSSAIKKLSVVEKPLIGYLQGHGEPKLEALQEVFQSLEVLYYTEPFELTDTVDNISKYPTIAIVAPSDSFPESHIRQINDFVAKGGNIFMALNRVGGQLQGNPPGGFEVNTGLEDWLASKGLQVENNFVIDFQCGRINVRQQQQGLTFSSQVAFPFLPIVNKFDEHTITTGMEQLAFMFASQLNYMGDSSLTFTPIIKSSEKSGTYPSYAIFDVSKRWNDNDFPLSELTMGGILSGKIAGQEDSRIIVIGDGDFAINGEGEAFRRQPPDNISLMVNSIDYLSDDTGLIELRTKGVTSRPLEQIEDGKRTFLKYLNFLLPVILILIYGFIRLQYRRNLRIKRMEEGYV